jgi:hypothetical protein
MAGRDVPPKTLEHVVARTIAGFLNQEGGLLIIGARNPVHRPPEPRTMSSTPPLWGLAGGFAILHRESKGLTYR